MTDRTIYKYLDAGAWMRISKEVNNQTIIALSNILPKKDIPHGGQRELIKLSSKAEEQLYKDYPDLEHFQNVFYGSIQVRPRSNIDRSVLYFIRSILIHMLKVVEINLKICDEEATE